jgi:hypothetical protein
MKTPLACVLLSLTIASPALAWDAAGHRAVTWLALDGLSSDTPAFLREPEYRHAIGWQAAEPDRWRSLRSNYLVHENAPDHYIDVEDLEKYGLTLSTIPPLRMQYIAAMAVARHVHPEKIAPHNPKLDPAGQNEWPGFLPHAIMEHHAKLASSFKTLRTLEKLNDPARAPQLEQTKRNIAVEMGILSHFVGDANQPLHTTKHFNGWVGDNPKAYTTDKKFHAYIDGGVIRNNKINYEMVKQTAATPVKVDPVDPWNDVLSYIQRSFDKVEPLYIMQKEGTLDAAPGKEFICTQLRDAGAMLAALYNSAWQASTVTDKEVEQFVKFDSFDPADLPADARPSAKAPAPADATIPAVPK